MTELIGYTVVNGVKARNYKYKATVETQNEIEQRKLPLIELHTKEKVISKGYFDQEEDKFDIIFITRAKATSKNRLKG